jgi:IS30 family transposase
MLIWGNFQTSIDKIIWEFHAEHGMTSREIAPRIGLHQSNIVRRLHRIENGLKFSLSSLSFQSATF